MLLIFIPKNINNTESQITAIICVALIAIASFYLLLTEYYWKKKRFPSFYLYNKKNFIKAITCIGIKLTRIERNDQKLKLGLINKYVNQVFNNYGNIRSLLVSENYQAATNVSVCAWLRKHLDKFDEFAFVLFCVQLIAIDGHVNSKEQSEIDEIAKLLGVSKIEYQAFIDRVNEKFFSKEEKNFTDRPKYEDTNLALQFFGFKVIPTIVQLKSDFRKRVKTCHPDLFPTIAPEKKKELEFKFNELQKYYNELLLIIEE